MKYKDKLGNMSWKFTLSSVYDINMLYVDNYYDVNSKIKFKNDLQLNGTSNH